MRTTTRPRTTRNRIPILLLAVLLATLTALVGCSSGSGGSADSAAGLTVREPAAARERAGDAAADGAKGTKGSDRSVSESSTRPRERAVIATGTVSLRSDDVAEARSQVQQVVDELGGEVAEEETGTGDAGEIIRSRMVLRVPSGDFDTAMSRLAEVAELERTTRSTEDVTTQVIDVRARIRAQQKSLHRVEALLAEAEDLADVIALESELTSRRAELDSLRSQQAWLADQTSMATITVHLSRLAEAEPDGTVEAGFLSGLIAGWDALATTLLAVATVLGAALPFTVLAGVVGVPAWLLLRRRRRTA